MKRWLSWSLIVLALASCAAPQPSDNPVRGSSGEGGRESALLCAGERFEGEPLSLTVVTNSGPQAAPYILWAEARNCFEENGLDVTLVETGAPSDRLAALVSGSAGVAWLPVDPLLAAVINGGIDLTVVSPHYGYSAERIALARSAREFSGTLILDGVALSAPGTRLEDLTELEGGKFGRQSAISNVGVDLALLEAGADLETIQWVDVEQSERLNALLRGDLDAAVLSGINALKALRGGAEFLFYYQAWDRDGGIDNYWVSTSNGAKAEREQLQRFRQAMWDAYRLLQQPGPGRDFLRFMIDVLEGEPEDADALSLPEFFLRPVALGDLQAHMDVMFARGDIDRTVELRETSLFDFDRN